MPPDRSTVADALRAAQIDRTDARMLLQHVLDMDHAALIAHGERALTAAESGRYKSLVNRRETGEPIAYLVGWREFYGRCFAVDPAVLIPRPETELLVELALARIDPESDAAVLDLATGSGNIAVTIALERPAARLVATDASTPALARARDNARRLGAERIEMLSGDWFAPVAGRRFDLIVSNPPYVAASDPHLAEGDLRYEPRAALAAGADGLDAIRAIVRRAQDHLKHGGWLLFEHGYDQGKACAELLEEAGFNARLRVNDLAGLPRVSGGRRES